MKMAQMFTQKVRSTAVKTMAWLTLSASVVGCASWPVQERITSSQRKISELQQVLPKTDSLQALCARGERQAFLANYKKADSLYQLINLEYSALSAASAEALVAFNLKPTDTVSVYAPAKEAPSDWSLTYSRTPMSSEERTKQFNSSMAGYTSTQKYWLSNWTQVKAGRAQLSIDWDQLKSLINCSPSSVPLDSVRVSMQVGQSSK